MTTIAADLRSGIMVGDSKVTTAPTWFPMAKIYRWKGEIVGIAGDFKQSAEWFTWYKNGKHGSPPKLDEFEALVLRKDGLFLLACNSFEIPIERGFHAIGSGGPAATAVMLAGHDAKEAVRIACLVDAESGGDIQLLHLKAPA